MCRGQRGPQGSLRQGGSTSAGLHMDIDIVTDNHIVDIVSVFYNFSFHQAAATAKSGKSASKSGSLKVEKLTKLLKLQITATTT